MTRRGGLTANDGEQSGNAIISVVITTIGPGCRASTSHILDQRTRSSHHSANTDFTATRDHPFAQVDQLCYMSFGNGNVIWIIHSPRGCPKNAGVPLWHDDVAIIKWSKQVNDHI